MVGHALVDGVLGEGFAEVALARAGRESAALYRNTDCHPGAGRRRKRRPAHRNTIRSHTASAEEDVRKP